MATLPAGHPASPYHGPPELTLTRAVTEWTADLPMIALVLVLGVGYLVAARRARRSGATWARGRTVAFCGLGLGFLLIATMSWVGVYQNILFYARAAQTVLLVLVVPLFLAMGKPLTLLSAALPAAGRRAEAVIRSRAAAIVTFPAITTFALVAVPFSLYFTSWYQATFYSATARELTYLALLAPGYLFFWTLLRVDPVPKAYSYGVSMWITAAEVVGDAFFGIAVIADQSILGASFYHALARPWGPSPATDQVIGGGVLWILGDFVGLPFLAVQLIQLMREDHAEAIVIDAELDARDAARAAARAAPRADTAGAAADSAAEYSAAEDRTAGHGPTAAATAPGAVPDPGPDDDSGLPWWEADPRFTERFR